MASCSTSTTARAGCRPPTTPGSTAPRAWRTPVTLSPPIRPWPEIDPARLPDDLLDDEEAGDGDGDENDSADYDSASDDGVTDAIA